MDSVLAVSFAAAAILFSTLLLLSSRRKPALGLPPGPPSLPLIGNLHQLLGKQPHEAMGEMAAKYGPLLTLRLGSVLAVVASSPETIKEFLQTHDLLCCSRPRVRNAELLTYGQSGIMWAPYGPEWRQLRRVCVLDLFTAKRIEFFRPVREEEVGKLVQRLFAACQERKAVQLREALTVFAWSVVFRMVSSKQPEVDITEGLRIKSIMDRGLELAGSFNLSDYLPLLRRLDLQGFRAETETVHARLDAFFQALIDKHRNENSAKEDAEDFISILISTSGLTDDKIKATVQDIFAAGTDTTALVIEWAMTELIRNPEALLKARRELDEVIGRERLVTEADEDKLVYLQAVVKETLRLHPPGPLLQHQAMERIQVCGYEIPAGARVIINLYGSARDARVWECPLQFQPDRFLTQQAGIDVRGRDFGLIPFGSGRRLCPGMALGLKNAHLLLAQLLHCFEWEVPPGAAQLDLSEVCGMTLRKAIPLILIPVLRLPAAIVLVLDKP